jgi:transcriptional regulator with XRE-family HTH domain
MAKSDDILLATFAEILREQRRTKGLSQEELAHRAGLSMRYISLLESQHHQPSLATLKGLCNGLELSMSEFLRLIEASLQEYGA